MSNFQSSLRAFITLERIWISVLCILSVSAVTAAIVYQPWLSHRHQLEIKADIRADLESDLVSRTASDPNDQSSTCMTMGGLILVHVEENEYLGQMQYQYTGQNRDTCGYANDGTCDEPSLCQLGTDTTDCQSNPPTITRQFTCRFNITADGQAWNLGIAATDDCLLNSRGRIQEACY